jgi:quinol-cytochrome oxidoreductase complex cytochrome b subunit
MPRMLMQLGKEIRPMGLICFVWLFSFLRVAFCLDFVDSCVVLHVKKKYKTVSVFINFGLIFTN